MYEGTYIQHYALSDQFSLSRNIHKEEVIRNLSYHLKERSMTMTIVRYADLTIARRTAAVSPAPVPFTSCKIKSHSSLSKTASTYYLKKSVPSDKAVA